MLQDATDARQTAEWGEFLTAIGWEVASIRRDASLRMTAANENAQSPFYIFIRKIPYLGWSFIKIQHPKGTIPFQAIDTLARKHHTLFTIIEPHVVGYDEQSFYKQRYSISKLRYAHSATILIDLRKSVDELWKTFSENARRNIRKAEKNIRVEISVLKEKDRGEQIRRFYELYAQLGKQKKFYVPPFSEVQAKMEAFAKTSVLLWAYENSPILSKEERLRNPMRFLADTRNDKRIEMMNAPIAVLWLGYVDHTLVYFHPGNTERGYDLLANYLLVWEAMKWGKQQGLKYFDFETAYDPRYPFENKQWQGYTEFKRKFGGEFIEFPPSYIKFYNPFIKLFYQFGTMFSR